MLYHFYELNHAAVAPLRTAAAVGRFWLRHPMNPLGWTPAGKAIDAYWDVFEGLTRQYGKPEFGIPAVNVDGREVAIREEDVLTKTFCALKHFVRDPGALPAGRGNDPRVLLIAPMSGHYATLLRGTVKALVADHEVYVTDWADARNVPVALGRFDLDDYIDYLIAFLRHLGPNTHVMAVCQPGPAALAATALLAADGDACTPSSLTILGSPIDTRLSPTEPNRLATTRPLSWFENNVIMRVPFPHAGCMRRVYPGFLQLTGFMTMNLDRHMNAHQKLYQSLVVGDGDSVAAHRRFYDEYLAVMDLTAEYYLQTLDVVFQQHLLPRGLMTHRGRRVEPGAITRTALMTVEGEHDDISGIGQTQAAHALCANLPASLQADYVQPGVGHYGVFNGSRWRTEIYPRVREFIRAHNRS
ncbi:MAG: polyhydroxyalkanoate depolymerase [Gammaproteobacteria bacterium]|nr:polyhydroxyalkanoate depolymerase [Gammaproteobacteria bacterium]MBI5616249.1 polyhydroxyalkanoate depolymerase [Gammaproteobacteria bacterium]